MEQTALKEFVDGVVPMMGEKLEQIILYGSGPWNQHGGI